MIILLHAGFLLGWFPILKMEVIHSSETSVHLRTKRAIYPRRWQRNYRCGNGKPYIFSFTFALSDVILCANPMKIPRTWPHVKPCAVPWNTFQLKSSESPSLVSLLFSIDTSNLLSMIISGLFNHATLNYTDLTVKYSKTFVRWCFAKTRKIISRMLKILIYAVRSPDTILKQLHLVIPILRQYLYLLAAHWS
jgi:hypothetical protein